MRWWASERNLFKVHTYFLTQFLTYTHTYTKNNKRDQNNTKTYWLLGMYEVWDSVTVLLKLNACLDAPYLSPEQDIVWICDAGAH